MRFGGGGQLACPPECPDFQTADCSDLASHCAREQLPIHLDIALMGRRRALDGAVDLRKVIVSGTLSS